MLCEKNQGQPDGEHGVLVPVTKQQIQEYKEQGGYINYIGHHGVEKETSTTTPLRIMLKSVLKNCNTGPSVNDLWPKGPTVCPTCSTSS